MGRPKKNVDELPRNEVVDGLIADYKARIAMSGAEFLKEEDKKIIPLSPVFDAYLGGGISEGSLVILAGTEGCGKSQTALHFAARCQRSENGGRMVFYHAIEHRVSVRDLKSIPGLDLDKIIIVRSSPAILDDEGNVVTPAKILTATEHLDLAEKEMRDYPGCLIVFDSISMLLSQKEAEKEIEDQQIGEAARLLHKFCRRSAPILDVNNCILICIVQGYSSIGPHGKSFIEKGGRSIKYLANVHLRCTYAADWKEKDTDPKPMGKIPEWTIVKANLSGGIPGSKFQSYIRYGIGIDEIFELIQVGLSLGMIDQSGAWFTLSFMQDYDKDYIDKKYKVQGAAKLAERLRSDPECVKYLQKHLKMMVSGS